MNFLSRIFRCQPGHQVPSGSIGEVTSFSPKSVPKVIDVAFTQAGIDNLPEKIDEILSGPQVAEMELLNLFDTARKIPEMALSAEKIIPFLVRIKREFDRQPKLAIARTSPSSAYINLRYIKQHGLGGTSARLVYPRGAQKQGLYTVADFLDTLGYEARQRGYHVVDVVPRSG